VRSKKDVEEARFVLGNKSHIKVMTKIQNATVKNNILNEKFMEQGT